MSVFICGLQRHASRRDQLTYLGFGNLRQWQAFETVCVEILEITFALDTQGAQLCVCVRERESDGESKSDLKNSLLHLECHFFFLTTQSFISFSRSFWPLKRDPQDWDWRLRLEIEIKWRYKCNRLYLFFALDREPPKMRENTRKVLCRPRTCRFSTFQYWQVVNRQLLRLLSTYVWVHESLIVIYDTQVNKILYHWTLLLNPTRCCET